MGKQARVTKIDAIPRFRGALKVYEERMRDVVVNIELELRRVEDWITHDRPAYWRAQYERASRELSDTRTALERCETSAASDERRSCTVERKMYEMARRRLALTETKMRTVRAWQRTLHRELTEMKSHAAKLGHMLDDEVGHGLATLDRIVAALQKYTSMSEGNPAATSDADHTPASTHGVSASPTLPPDELMNSGDGATDGEGDGAGRSIDHQIAAAMSESETGAVSDERASSLEADDRGSDDMAGVRD